MEFSNAWDWGSVKDIDGWLEPSEEGHYYCHRWGREGRRRVLDLGCGLGRHSMLFARNGFEVTAVDTSEEAISSLKKRSAGMEIICDVADMHHLPYKDGSFDCVFAYHSISHTDSKGIVKILSEIRRVLSPGGKLFLTLCSKDTWSFKEADFPVIDGCTRVRTDGAEKGIPHFYVDRDDIIRLMESFELIRIRHVDDCFSNGIWKNCKHYFIEAERP